MIGGLAVLLVFQLAGEVLSTHLNLPIPGSICGMALLLVALFLRGELPADVGAAADGIIKNMAVLFVPAGVGIMAHADLLEPFGLSIAALLVGSTLITFVTTALTGHIVNGSPRAIIPDQNIGRVVRVSVDVANDGSEKAETAAHVGAPLHLNDK